MKIKKTYGVAGYIEWIASINTGSASLQVPFSGGAITKYGIVPAEYATSDPAIQYIIENSDQYGDDKRIRLLRAENLPAPEKSGKSPGKMRTIHVSNFTDAVQILHDEFGIPSASVGSKAEAKRIGLEYNVILEGI